MVSGGDVAGTTGAGRTAPENPELSLKELGELLSNPIDAPVNHRFQKIAAMAEELRKRAANS
ncbi:MAG: hypothetical protein ACLR5S_07430 [Ruminococcus sp.]